MNEKFSLACKQYQKLSPNSRKKYQFQKIYISDKSFIATGDVNKYDTHNNKKRNIVTLCNEATLFLFRCFEELEVIIFVLWAKSNV